MYHFSEFRREYKPISVFRPSNNLPPPTKVKVTLNQKTHLSRQASSHSDMTYCLSLNLFVINANHNDDFVIIRVMLET